MILGTVFDVDGVLLDSLSVWNDLGIRYVRSLGKEPVEGMEEVLYSLSMEEGSSYLKKTFSISRSIQEITGDLEKMIEDFYADTVQAKPGVTEVLKYLKENRIPAVCATSCPRKLVESAMKRNDLMKYIQHVFYGDENHTAKSEVLLFDMASSFLKADKNEVLIVEDAAYALETARKNGYRTAGIYDANNEKYQKELKRASDWYCRDMNELLEKLKKEGQKKCIQL